MGKKAVDDPSIAALLLNAYTSVKAFALRTSTRPGRSRPALIPR
jgi:hypothetical protein